MTYRRTFAALGVTLGVAYLLGCEPVSSIESPTGETTRSLSNRATTWTVRRPMSMPIGGTSEVYFADSGVASSSVNVVRMGAIFTESTEKTLDCYTSHKPNEELSNEVIRAARRGIQVRAILPAEFLASADGRRWLAAGIECKSDPLATESDQDFIVADGDRLLVGSWDFISGQPSDSSLLFWLDEEEVASAFADWFHSQWQKENLSHRVLPKSVGSVNSPARTRATIGLPKQSSHSIEQAIRRARRSVHFLAGDLIDDEITSALTEAARRGVEVSGVVGSHEQRGGVELQQLNELERVHILMAGSASQGMRHNFYIVDGNFVMILSRMPRKNANSLDVLSVITTRDGKLLASFKDEFARIQGRAAATVASRLERAFR
ncbi:hypothetical protein K2Y11_05115 [bacterium]|nr:hypothetical protein [bacterium]